MKRSGLHGCEPIHRYCPCQREPSLQIALKPLCFMTAMRMQSLLQSRYASHRLGSVIFENKIGFLGLYFRYDCQ